ncbi:MAG: SMC-Scp complex subunit ScpB [Anaerolineales bacterium]|nr:SMC-Scp complex subunit ScpB [Anaerolineales bacterium]
MSDSNHSSSDAEIAADYSTQKKEANPTGSVIDLTARIEALLFVSPELISIPQIAIALNSTMREVEKSLEELDRLFVNRGIRLQRISRTVQLITAPEISEDVQRFLDLEETTRLSRAALEVLAIVAYQEPVTRPQIDAVRGVNSDSVIRTLLRHGLVDEVGRTDAPGRPFIYATTSDFLNHFGLTSNEELPPLNLESEIGGLDENVDSHTDTEDDASG